MDLRLCDVRYATRESQNVGTMFAFGDDLLQRSEKTSAGTLINLFGRKKESTEEWDSLRFQFATSKRGGRRYLPYAFTEQGVAMLSGLLNSDIAIDVNIKIMRAFVFVRQYALNYADLKQELDNFMLTANMQFNEIYQALTELTEQKRLADKPRRAIGYLTEEQHKELEKKKT
jgi:hypothetical protein